MGWSECKSFHSHFSAHTGTRTASVQNSTKQPPPVGPPPPPPPPGSSAPRVGLTWQQPACTHEVISPTFCKDDWPQGYLSKACHYVARDTHGICRKLMTVSGKYLRPRSPYGSIQGREILQCIQDNMFSWACKGISLYCGGVATVGVWLLCGGVWRGVTFTSMLPQTALCCDLHPINIKLTKYMSTFSLHHLLRTPLPYIALVHR